MSDTQSRTWTQRGGESASSTSSSAAPPETGSTSPPARRRVEDIVTGHLRSSIIVKKIIEQDINIVQLFGLSKDCEG